MESVLLVIGIMLGLILGLLLCKDKIKSAFTGLFMNPSYSNPVVSWKGIDQNLFKNPDFNITNETCNCPLAGSKEKMCGCIVNSLHDWNPKVDSKLFNESN